MTEQTIPSDVPTEKDTQQPEAKKSRWRFLWCGLLILGIMLLVLLGFLATGKGQRTTLEQLDRWLEPLSIEEVSGSLQDGLLLKNFRIRQEGFALGLEEGLFQVDFDCFWQLKVCAKLSSNHFTLSAGKTDVVLDKFQTSLEASGRTAKLSHSLLSGLRLSLPQAVKNTEKVVTPEYWENLVRRFEQPLIDKSTFRTFPLQLTIENLHAENLSIEQKTADPENPRLHIALIENLSLNTEASAERFAITELNAKSDRGTLLAEGELSLLNDAPLNFLLKADINEWKEIALPASQVELQLSGGLFDRTELRLNTHGALNAQLNGNISLSTPKLPFSLTLSAPEAAYPFMVSNGQAQLYLRKTEISLLGNILNYRLNGQAEVSGLGLPKTVIELLGQGSLTAFDVAMLKLNMLQGSSILKGQIAWRNGFEWNAEMDLDKLYTKELFSESQAFVSGKLQSEGYVGRGTSGQDWAISFNELKLAGVLSGRPLVLLGDLSFTPHEIKTPSTKLSYGINMLEMAGNLSRNSDFSAKIHAPDLTGFLPTLKGNVQGETRLLGKWTEPQLKLTLNAEHFSYRRVALAGLKISGEAQTENQVVGTLDAELSQFNFDEIEASQAKLSLKGDEQQHRLQFTSKGQPFGLNLNANGGFDRKSGVWSGQLSDLLIASPIGDWRNDKAVDVAFNSRAVQTNISAHCWQHTQAKLCFPKAFEAGKEGSVPFEVKPFNLSTLQTFLPADSQLEGVVNAAGSIQWFAKQPPRADVLVESSRVAFTQKIDYRQLPIVFSPLKLELNLSEDSLQLKSDLALEDNGTAQAEILLKALSGNRQLSGNIQLNGLNINLFQPLIGRNELLDGELNGRLTLAGTAVAPLLQGNVNLSDINVKMLSMPFDITDGQLNMQFHGNRSSLSGRIQSKEKRLQVEGEADWQKLDAWHTTVSAKGERFRIELPGMAKLDVSPNVQLYANAQRLSITGEVDVPWARVEIEELPDSAVSVSADEVIMDGSAKQKKRFIFTPQAVKKHKGMDISSDIAINIGDDVRLDAYGLKTHLRGSVKVRHGEKGLGLYGQVNLRNGTFASFGQDLVLRKGVISFTGSPTQPTLDVEAIRNPEAMEDSTITAGVRVSGMVDSPNVQIFSVPALPQDQALSYILSGRALDSAGDGSASNSVAAALVGLSLSKSSKLVGSVGSAFGINDLNVTTAGIGDNTKVVVSGNLSPRFRVQYGVGLFAPLTELTLRYRLAPSLYLQMISNVNQAVDLLYRFEF